MARSDAPFGFVPVRRQDNSGLPSPNAYWVDSSDSTALHIGDPVILDGTSNTATVEAVGVGKFGPGKLAGVTRATAGATNKILGVITSIAAITRDSDPYRAASTERVVLVCDDPQAVFQVQADAAVATASVGLNTNVLFTHAGSTVTGISGAEADATAAADATYQLNILGFANREDNVANAVGNILEVTINLHQRTTGVGQAGV